MVWALSGQGLSPTSVWSDLGRYYCPCMVHWPPWYPHIGCSPRGSWAPSWPGRAGHGTGCVRSPRSPGFLLLERAGGCTAWPAQAQRFSLLHPRGSGGNSVWQAYLVFKGFLYNSDLFILLILPLSVHPAYTHSCQASNGRQKKPILF